MQQPPQIPYYPMQQQPVVQQPSTATKVALSGVRIVGCLTIVLGFGIAVAGCLAGVNMVAIVVGCGIAIVGVLAASVNKVA